MYTTVFCTPMQEEEAYGQQLEQQISVLRGASGTLEATTRQQAESQGPMYFNLTAQAGAQQALEPAARHPWHPLGGGACMPCLGHISTCSTVTA
jgi:hypothetical protein